MVYDNQPWQDHFRILDDGKDSGQIMLLGIWCCHEKIGGWFTLQQFNELDEATQNVHQINSARFYVRPNADFLRTGCGGAATTPQPFGRRRSSQKSPSGNTPPGSSTNRRISMSGSSSASQSRQTTPLQSLRRQSIQPMHQQLGPQSSPTGSRPSFSSHQAAAAAATAAHAAATGIEPRSPTAPLPPSTTAGGNVANISPNQVNKNLNGMNGQHQDGFMLEAAAAATAAAAVRQQQQLQQQRDSSRQAYAQPQSSSFNGQDNGQGIITGSLSQPLPQQQQQQQQHQMIMSASPLSTISQRRALKGGSKSPNSSPMMAVRSVATSRQR
jgi:hypothetical protein